MTSKLEKDIPKLRPTPLTWLYIAFGILVVVLTIWGLSAAGAP